MLGVGWEDLTGRYLLEWMPLHGAKRTTKICRKVRGYVGGALCHFVVEQVYSGAFEESMRWCACAVVAARYCLLVHARLCSVQRILPHRMCG